ncbi:YaaA family protein [Streptomyces caniscabiei]|uniref:YaaA family protein n=1 Tax=Streptomyces caniscabiei TaxID=2746961 RepID=UPI0029BA2548|nr:YaaA family protein [Streptomyces caniscabiei]MDX2776181.1 YaaA family protein [Streptomyces caniscabiei]
MQVLLAPSKTMTMKYALPKGCEATAPHFMVDARRIVDAIRNQTDIATLMHVSDAIANDVRVLYGKWGNDQAPALYAYKGDVYRWFFAETLSRNDLEWAQARLFILSGLYGVLRPLDLVSPYRLEMKTKLSIKGSRDLYDFWGTRIAQYVDRNDDALLCNLSSDEYAKVITKWTRKRIVTPVFLDNKNNGTVGTVPIYSKMMRGVMARWIIDHRVESPDELASFESQGYSYDAARSTCNTPVFYRSTPKPIRF